jgi:hypothetical protein
MSDVSDRYVAKMNLGEPALFGIVALSYAAKRGACHAALRSTGVGVLIT